MDIIRFYCNSMDVQPNVLLRHFLRYLGFYVDERCDRKWTLKWQSVADIHIVSDVYMEGENGEIELTDFSKSIYIFKDTWRMDDSEAKTVYYNGHTQDSFLLKVVEHLCDIIEENDAGAALLTQSDWEWRDMVQYLTRVYLNRKLLEASLFTCCFYKHDFFCREAFKSYKGFLDDLEIHAPFLYDSDLFRFASLYAKYELDLVCKKNLLQFMYDPDELLDECADLLFYYSENEELYLLKADIMFELQDDWLWACDEYADSHIMPCAYAHYKQGKIFRSYLKEFDNAVVSLQRAIKRKGDYCYAYYQLGECYEEQAKYEEAISAFKKINNILEEKYEAHLLAPLELEYLYKSVMKIAAIYKTRIGDYDSAYAYNNLAKTIREEHAIDRYTKLILENNPNIDLREISLRIDKTMMKQVDLKLDQIF